MQRVLLENEIDVPLEQLKLLMFLSFHPGVNQQVVCDEMNKTKPGISRLMDSLEQKGLIERREDPLDRRNKINSITDLGHQTKAKFYPIGIGNLRNIENELGAETSAEFKKHLIAIKEIILNKLNK